MTRNTWAWVAVGLAAHILDVLTTHLGLAGGASEANPIMANIFAAQGELAGHAVKLVMVLAVITFVVVARRRYPAAWRVYQALAVATWGVVANNLAVVRPF